MIFIKKKEKFNSEIEYRISNSGLEIGFNKKGQIVAVAQANNREFPYEGMTLLKDYSLNDDIKVSRENTKILFVKTFTDKKKRVCIVKESFEVLEKSVRWEVELESKDEYSTTEILTKINYSATKKTRFWTAWSDPEHKSFHWRDPLVLMPLSNREWEYSNIKKYTPEYGKFISIPIATIVEVESDFGVSIALSPEDPIFNMYLSTNKKGEFLFKRQNHRFGKGNKIRLSMDIILHEADWRGGLRFYKERYKHFFEPKNPIANKMAGCGAYSGYEGNIDSARLRRMAFSVNWKLSDDFPYMGMFLPPLKNPEDTWTRSCDEPTPKGKMPIISFKQMNDYAIRMKKEGFFVLNYFNVTEFGKKMNSKLWKENLPKEEAWKNPVQFLKENMPNAILDPWLKTFYGAKITDCGDKNYQDFLIEQAKRHIEMLPDTEGVCIDRMDWIRYFNFKADDGISMVKEKLTRALVISWKEFSKRLSETMHPFKKVIFVNPMNMRIDLFENVDGFFSEHGESGGGLNSMAFVSLEKTAITWTCMWWYFPSFKLKPDPDRFFQRHLHMGVFPIAPFPFNNHALRPNKDTDKHYLDYGPLLKTLRGKKWVLAPHCVESSTKNVKVNLFETENGFVIPVTFGFGHNLASILVRNIPCLKNMRVTVLHPESELESSLTVEWKLDAMVIHVPLVRGCAIVNLK